MRADFSWPQSSQNPNTEATILEKICRCYSHVFWEDCGQENSMKTLEVTQEYAYENRYSFKRWQMWIAQDGTYFWRGYKMYLIYKYEMFCVLLLNSWYLFFSTTFARSTIYIKKSNMVFVHFKIQSIRGSW